MQGLEAAAVAADAELVGRFCVQAEVHAHCFLLLGDPEAHRLVDRQGDDGGQDGRVGDGDAGRCELGPELGQAAAVEQAAADALNRESDEAKCHGADDARDQVDANNVQ